QIIPQGATSDDHTPRGRFLMWSGGPRSVGRRGAALVAVFCAWILAAQGAAAEPGPMQPVRVTAADVQRAIEQFEPALLDVMARTGVPGVAVGVVFEDRLFWAKGYGVREVGTPEPVDEYAVFQLASVSKPIASTLVARLVGEGHVAW